MYDPATIRKKLADLRCRTLTEGEQAAVLLGLVQRSPDLCLVLTRRSESVATHKGQISFPGGLRESGDADLVATALRETAEEIGVPPQSVEVLGLFHEYPAVTGHRVRAVVGMIDPAASYRPHSVEVAYVLEIPVGFFLETPPAVESREVRGQVRDVYFWDFRGELVWGLTARMIKDFVEFVVL
jgi:8-oxo-dGTP pyrophosphatase MutT (NUDIX family)